MAREKAKKSIRDEYDRAEAERARVSATMTDDDACPFCKILPDEDDGPWITGTHPGTDWVECGNCGACGPEQEKYDKPKGAAQRALDAWRWARKP